MDDFYRLYSALLIDLGLDSSILEISDSNNKIDKIANKLDLIVRLYRFENNVSTRYKIHLNNYDIYIKFYNVNDDCSYKIYQNDDCKFIIQEISYYSVHKYLLHPPKLDITQEDFVKADIEFNNMYKILNIRLYRLLETMSVEKFTDNYYIKPISIGDKEWKKF